MTTSKLYQGPIAPARLITDSARSIGRLLQRQQRAGRRQDEIFRDWVCLLEAVLVSMTKEQLTALRRGNEAQTRQFIDQFLRGEAVSDGGNAQRYYREPHWERFAQMTALLLENVRQGYADYLAPIFSEYSYPNKMADQYFTPWELALHTARSWLYDVVPQVERRLSEAYRQFYEDQVRSQDGVQSMAAQADGQNWHWTERLVRLSIPILRPHYTPYRIFDPSAGSATLLLAAAAYIPCWMIELGLVEFYGVELDPFVARMASVNFALYGLPLKLGVGDFFRLRTDLKFDLILINPPFSGKLSERNRSKKKKRITA